MSAPVLELHALRCGGERIRMAALDPFDADPGQVVPIPWFAYLIKHPEGNVLFDTGPHPLLGTDPVSRLGTGADTWDIDVGPDDNIVSQLARAGVSPAEITRIAVSHLHLDHGGGLEFFPDVEVLVQRKELRFAFWPPVYQRSAYARKDFEGDVRWKELSGRYDIFGDGRLVLIPTPGHTPGHQSLLVKLQNESKILVGDAAYLPQKMRDRCLPAGSLVWSPDHMVTSWEELEELQRTLGAEIICNHDPDYKGHLRVSPKEWYV